jgi:peptidoglycan/xylan/chitin deacetylase (PgdA/CDA1 family)
LSSPALAACDRPLILAYHSVSPQRTDALSVDPADFEGQMAWLRRHGYQALTLADLAARSPNERKRAVALTFDDGYADNYTHAFPVLKRYGFVATVFVVSDHVGTDRLFPWDVPKLRNETDRVLYQALSWDHVREMQDHGFEIGSHTCTHPELPGVSEERCREEIERSRRDLEARLGRAVDSFCYPRGKLDPAVVRLVEQAGYRWGVVTPKRSGIPRGPLTLRRVGVYHDTGAGKFRIKVNPLVRRFWEPALWLRGRHG